MWNIQIFGTDMYHLLSWFFAYSVFGWCIESLYMSFQNKKLTNRGFVRGPICPIYGMGALTVYFMLRPFAGNYILIYFLGTMMATSLELLTALTMKRVFGFVWWDYSNKPFNYKGILCLESSIAWGFYSVFEFLFIQREIEAFVNRIHVTLGKYVILLLLIYFIADMMICLNNAAKGEVLAQENNLLAFMTRDNERE